MNISYRNNKAFTLLELLVVIAIVGILANVVLSSLNSTRMKARDATRKHDIYEINKAIQLYIDENDSAPIIEDVTGLSGSGDYYYTTGENLQYWDILETKLSPYLSKLPKDPCGIKCYGSIGSGFYTYEYQGPSVDSIDKKKYAVWASNGELGAKSMLESGITFGTSGINGYTCPVSWPVQGTTGCDKRFFFGYNNIMGYQYNR